MHEFEIIKKYFLKLSNNNKSALNLSDDVFYDKSKQLVISIDTYVEGIHFINFKKPELVIKKIFRSSISDLICKGVRPKYYFISASGNSRSFSKSNLKKISKSLKQEQKKFNIYLGGGDTVLSKKLSFPKDKIINTVDIHANTSAASIPLAFSHAVENKIIKNGDIIAMNAIGGGLSWGASVIKFGKPN